MSDISKDTILTTITRAYLDSHDFNGISAVGLIAERDTEWSQLLGMLRELIEDDVLIPALITNSFRPFPRIGKPSQY